MSTYNTASAKQYIINIMSIQLFVTLVSLPIFIAWGIPISLFSIIGNMIFAPVLTLYIFVCSLIFLSSLCNIPCKGLIWILDMISTAWLTTLDYIPNTLQIGIAQPSPIVLVAIAFFTLLILHAKRLKKEQKCFLYAALFISIIGVSQWHKYTQKSIVSIPCFSGSVYLITTNNTTIIVDPGCIGQRISAPSWAEYTLLPTIIKHTGHTYIDHIITMLPNRFTCNALETLCKKSAAKTIHIPFWKTIHSRSLHGAFSELKKVADKHHCTIVRFGSPQTYLLDQLIDVAITTHETCKITKKDVCFPCTHVHGHIDNKPFSFYASKHKKHKTLSSSS